MEKIFKKVWSATVRPYELGTLRLSIHTNAKHFLGGSFCWSFVMLGHHNGSKKRDNNIETNNRKRFCESLKTLCDRAAKNAEQQISGDCLRTEKAKKEDVGFLLDQRNARQMQMAILDHQSREKCRRKRQRVETKNLKILQALSS